MATPNRGQFKKGADPRRHKFTREECQAGFWKAIESIVIRFPDAVDSAGRHMAVKFLRRRRQMDRALEDYKTDLESGRTLARSNPSTRRSE